jgi:hypothetical protein
VREDFQDHLAMLDILVRWENVDQKVIVDYPEMTVEFVREVSFCLMCHLKLHFSTKLGSV